MDWTRRMGWTQRMTDVDDARRELQALGRKPTLREIGEKIGVSPERVRQVLDKIERYNRRTVPTYDEHVKCWRHWMAENFQAWLPLIIRGARDLKLSRETPVDKRERMRQYRLRYRERDRERQEQYQAENAERIEAARRRSEYYREQAAERLRKEREFPPPPDPIDVTCMMRGTELYERLRRWRGLPKLDGAAELARWNRRSTR